MSETPGISFHEGPQGRIAHLAGTGLDVWEIIEMLQHFGSAERLAAESHLDRSHIRVAEAYGNANPVEIAEAVALNSLTPQEWIAKYPFVEVLGQ